VAPRKRTFLSSQLQKNIHAGASTRNKRTPRRIERRVRVVRRRRRTSLASGSILAARDFYLSAGQLVYHPDAPHLPDSCITRIKGDVANVDRRQARAIEFVDMPKNKMRSPIRSSTDTTAPANRIVGASQLFDGGYSRSDSKRVAMLRDAQHRLLSRFVDHPLGQAASFFGSLVPIFGVVETRGNGHGTRPFLGAAPHRLTQEAPCGSYFRSRNRRFRRMNDEPEEIERQRREYERNMGKILWAMMRKILWAISPLAIVFVVLWIVAYFWLLQE